MRYLYGASDEKFVKPVAVKVTEAPSPLSTYKFHLESITAGKSQDFDKNDVPIVFKCTPDKLLCLCVKVLDAFPQPEIYKWNIEDICKWLREYGYRQYQNTFRENLINGHTFLLLDASALAAMNIKDFDHIKHIAYGIRSLFFYEMTKFGRSITLYPEFHFEVFKLLKTKTGFKYDIIRRSDLWRKLQLIREKEPNYSHWELLERWLAFDNRREPFVRVGGIHRFNLYRCKQPSSGADATTYKLIQRCNCLPPCECYWKESDRRPPWRLTCLSHLPPDSEFVEKCQYCIAPCTCRWTSKKYITRNVLTCLQNAFPQKYGQLQTQPWQRSKNIDTMGLYRLSLL